VISESRCGEPNRSPKPSRNLDAFRLKHRFQVCDLATQFRGTLSAHDPTVHLEDKAVVGLQYVHRHAQAFQQIAAWISRRTCSCADLDSLLNKSVFVHIDRLRSGRIAIAIECGIGLKVII
jgi:hypothetical protein